MIRETLFPFSPGGLAESFDVVSCGVQTSADSKACEHLFWHNKVTVSLEMTQAYSCLLCNGHGAAYFIVLLSFSMCRTCVVAEAVRCHVRHSCLKLSWSTSFTEI